MQKRNPLLGLFLDLFPVVEGFLQLLPIDLDPLPSEQDQAVVGGHQLPPFVLVELLVAQGELDLEIEHRFHVELLLLGVADRHAHAGPGTFLPPVGQADQDAALLEDRCVLEEAIGLGGRQANGW